MPVTTYTTANGMLIGECTDNGPHINYLTDALGSIVACVDENLNTTYTAAYKPYGDVLASTGTAPRFTWVGSLGYLASAGVTYAEYSIRTRLFSYSSDSWTSLDSLWPAAQPYAYAVASPISKVDATGMLPTLDYSSNGCTIGPQGSATWVITWLVNNATADFRAWIVQKITFTPSPVVCGSPDVPLHKTCQPTNEYYERWLVVGHYVSLEVLPSFSEPTPDCAPGRIGSQPGPTDTWQPFGQMVTCSHGNNHITGDAVFLTCLAGKWSFPRTAGSNSCAHSAPSTSSEPNFAKAQVSLSRTMESSWSTCVIPPNPPNPSVMCQDAGNPPFASCTCTPSCKN